MNDSGFSKEQTEQLKARYESGESIYKISRSEHVGYAKIRMAIQEAGGVLLRQNQWRTRVRKITEDQSDEMAVQYLRGTSKRAIANAYDVSVATVTHHLRKSGITPRGEVAPRNHS